MSQFDPSDEEINKLQLAKLIKSKEKNAYSAGVEFSSFLIRNCRVILPMDLVGGDEHCLAVISRHNELEQWTVINSHKKLIVEI